MCYVYWYHRPGMDILTEGYVGVTNDLERRDWEHRNRKQNIHMQRAFEKYNDIVRTIIFEGLEDECYQEEAKFRPYEQIGWNIVPGGGKPPISKVGRKYSEDTRSKMSKTALGKPKPWLKGIPLTVESIEKRTIKQAKYYKITEPSGLEYTIQNLVKFCREHDLDHGCMFGVVKGKRKHHKGWTCQFDKYNNEFV